MPNDYQLFQYQVEGVSWLQSKRDNGYGFSAPPLIGLLADEMGLGKTAQALEAIKSQVKIGKTFLILVPGATVLQWQRNWNRWVLDNEPDEFGADGLYAITSSKSPVPKGMSAVMSHNLLAKKEIVSKLIPANFDGIIIDEIHRFGSDSSKRLTHLRALRNLTESKFELARIGLSGTPVRNYAKEIYNIANFLDPTRFRNSEEFSRKYLTYDRKALYNPHQFHADFGPYYLRRMESQVRKDMPEIRRTKLYTEITNPFLRKAYNHELDLMSNWEKGSRYLATEKNPHGQFTLLTYLQRLRHITGIAKAAEPAIIEPLTDYLNGEENANKLIVGMHHHFVYERLSRSFKGFKQFLIRGGMSVAEKDRVKDAFIHCEAPAILFLSIKAAGEGIDGLQYSGAHKIVTFERQWNGRDEEQFEKRVHRTGQTHSINSEITIAVGTVDEFYDEMIDMKRRITTQVEDQDYEHNPAFLRQLFERVVASRLSEKASVIENGENGSGYAQVGDIEKTLSDSLAI